jgi:transposase InsO family protein
MERSLTMAQHAQLYIVASRHPRVGKTLLARLLIEFLRLRGRPLVGYDLKTREPALATCFPNLVWPVDITDTRGQMALFDRIITDHWRTTVIDLGNGSVDQFFKVMAEIGFEREAWQNQIQPVVLYIADSAPFTAQTYAELRGRIVGSLRFSANFASSNYSFWRASSKLRCAAAAKIRSGKSVKCREPEVRTGLRSVRMTDHALMAFEADQRAHRHAEFFDFVGAAEIRQIDDEAGSQNIGAKLL